MLHFCMPARYLLALTSATKATIDNDELHKDRTYLAHHELESVIIIIFITIRYMQDKSQRGQG